MEINIGLVVDSAMGLVNTDRLKNMAIVNIERLLPLKINTV